MTDSVLSRPVTTPGTPATAAVCPYLLASDGRWRASTPARQHRCTVVSPPAILAAEKQRRLCLTTEHVACSTYLAATDPSEVGGASARATAHRRSRDVTRTAPLLLDHGRLAISVPILRADRGSGQQSGLVALMAVAFAAIVVARLSAGGPDLTPAQAIGGPSASPLATATAERTARPAATEGATRTLVPTEVEPSQPPGESTRTPGPARTYKVRSGDTLGGIAREFDTTVAVLQELNDIDNPRTLRVGQVLELP